MLTYWILAKTTNNQNSNSKQTLLTTTGVELVDTRDTTNSLPRENCYTTNGNSKQETEFGVTNGTSSPDQDLLELNDAVPNRKISLPGKL